MHAAYEKTINAHTKKDMEDILKEHGLHLAMNTFWFIANSDPYLASSYDLLHADDIGKWGKHLWPLLLEILGALKKRGIYLSIARWPGLKHFQSVTTLDFSYGQGYFDILKCIHAYACFHMFAGLHAITEQQIEKMKRYLKSYEHWCSIHTMYGKDFNFPKQHAPAHLKYDITHKGATINYNTPSGEGVQQEVQQAYVQTNGKRAEGQRTRINEYQEAIPCIRMAVDAYDAELKEQTGELESKEKQKITSPSEQQGHWKLGASEKHKTSKGIEVKNKGSLAFKNFHRNLVAFLRETCPTENIDGTPLKIIQYKCVYLRYQSQETW
ncbi:hypothetical protein K439DRAFT_1615996 [Ramaria rubella]|nr:hypothetical protein K439DRAFT_1615996 [Ramaria rubella]